MPRPQRRSLAPVGQLQAQHDTALALVGMQEV